VPHTHELPFVWENATRLSPQDKKLADTIHDLWVEFIKGNPMPVAGDAQWPAYNTQQRPTVILKSPPAVQDNPANREYQLWDGLMVK
jgi:para-nitrobenzyl esterase